MTTNSRRTAAYILSRWLLTKEFPSALLPKGGDRAFIQDLVYTTIRRLRALRKVLGLLVAKWPKGELEALLYIGAAQILYKPEVPDFAAVNETVEAARLSTKPEISRVVNGVLRNLLRRREEIENLIANFPVDERESYPRALYQHWVARFGEEGAEKLAMWHNRPAETFLARRDGTFEPLARGMRVEDAPGFASGDFIVQDPGTALAIELLEPSATDVIFDACAAPGGKTIQMAWRGAKVVACEINPKRRQRLEENLARLNFANPPRVVKSSDDVKDQLFAKVLVDAPCSNTGVLRRRVDARWNWSEEKLAALVRMQAEILDWCAKCVAPGGTLVYSTCSNETAENREQVDAFLARHPDFHLANMRESIPFESGHDGAFAAALIRD